MPVWVSAFLCQKDEEEKRNGWGEKAKGMSRKSEKDEGKK